MDLLDELLPTLLEWVPDVTPPLKSKPLTVKERIKWTAATLVIYLMMSQIPIFGSYGQANDPFFNQRLVLGSTRGTIMELGISPLLTTGLITSFLSTSTIYDMFTLKSVQMTQNEKIKRDCKIQKLLAILLCLFQSTAYVMSGMYGELKVVGTGNATMIVMQLFFAGLIMILFDEILSLGYGVCNSGVSLFVASNICTDIIWKSFAPVLVFTSQKGVQSDFIGVLPSTIKSLYQCFRNPSKIFTLFHFCFFDRGLGMSTLSNILGTVVIILLASYIRNCHFNLPLHRKNLTPGGGGIFNYTIKILYVGNMPVILFISFINNIFIISQNMSSRYKKVSLVKILGVWKSVGENTDYKIPISGLSYYLTSPTSIKNAVISDPTHFVIYTVLVVILCVFFAHAWVEISHTDAKVVSKRLKDQNLVLKKSRDSNDTVDLVLGRLIPSITTLGGIILGLMYVLSDLLGALGGGSGILLAVSTVSEILEFIVQDSEVSSYLL